MVMTKVLIDLDETMVRRLEGLKLGSLMWFDMEELYLVLKELSRVVRPDERMFIPFSGLPWSLISSDRKDGYWCLVEDGGRSYCLGNVFETKDLIFHALKDSVFGWMEKYCGGFISIWPDELSMYFANNLTVSGEGVFLESDQVSCVPLVFQVEMTTKETTIQVDVGKFNRTKCRYWVKTDSELPVSVGQQVWFENDSQNATAFRLYDTQKPFLSVLIDLVSFLVNELEYFLYLSPEGRWVFVESVSVCFPDFGGRIEFSVSWVNQLQRRQEKFSKKPLSSQPLWLVEG
jgi:hypothetical protein